MPSEYTKPRVPSDVFVGLHSAPIHQFDTKEVTNSGEDDLTLPVGYPMDDNIPVAASNIGNTDGLNYRHEVIPAGETRKVLVLVRGPATVNADMLPTTYYDTGGAINMGTFRTTIAALGIVSRDESDEQATLATNG